MIYKRKIIQITILISIVCLSLLIFAASNDKQSSKIEISGNKLLIYCVLDNESQNDRQLQKVYYSADDNRLSIGRQVMSDQEDLMMYNLPNTKEAHNKGNSVLKRDLESSFPNVKLNGKEFSYDMGSKAYTVYGHRDGIIVIEGSNIETAVNVDFISEYEGSNSFLPMLIYLDQYGVPKILVHYYQPLEDGT